MKDSSLLGLGRAMLPLPAMLWRNQVAQNARRAAAGRGFMSEDHHRVHHFVVGELPRRAEPLVPQLIAERLGLPLDRVNAILGDLEKHLTFLFRDRQGAVVWAYPVTAAVTPHRLSFSGGEQVYAA